MTVTIAENTHRLLAIIIYSTAIFKYIEIIIALTYMDTYV